MPEGLLVGQRLTIVGASARSAAFSALRAGFTPVAGDLFADWDLHCRCEAFRVEGYPGGLADFLQARPLDPWMYTGALENQPQLLRRLAACAMLWGNPGEVVERVRDPQRLERLLVGAGVAFAEVRPLGQQVPQDGSWLVKPLRSGGGRLVAPWKGRVPGGHASNVEDFYLQRWQPGWPCGAVYVAGQGAACLLGVTRQLVGRRWCGAAGYRYCGSIGPLRLRRHIRDAFLRVGQVLADGCGLTGLFGVDVVVERGGSVWVLEVNPRYTASVEVIEWATGVPAVELHADACLGGGVPSGTVGARGGKSRVCGKAILYAGQDMVVPPHTRLHGLVSRHSAPWPRFADLPRPETRIERGHPVATALVLGKGLPAVLRRLRRRLKLLGQGLAAKPERFR